MANYDINTLDRLLFSTTGTDNLGSTDMGIGTNSGDSDYLTYNVPSGYHRFKVNGNLAMSVGPTSNPGLTVENSFMGFWKHYSNRKCYIPTRDYIR